MRLFSCGTHGLLSWFLPSNYRSARYIREVQKLFVLEIKRRQALLAAGNLDATDTLLSWMIEWAQGAAEDPLHLAHPEIVISLALIHTSQMNVVHVLYDLAARPEYIAELCDEICNVVNAKGCVTDLLYIERHIRRTQGFLIYR
ncbi:hypothetical protein GGR55DRAFT_676426 [Xylaria sp. FL0064]|nr:hypothetical protein GGR55DRAFT_676426 [Xylaria sp. FL0064]